MGIYKIQGSPYWHYDFTVKGVRYRGSTETAKRTDAETLYASERRKALLGEEEPDALSLEEAFIRYETEHAVFLNSYNRVQDHVNHLLAHFGRKRPLHTIGQADLESYVAVCRKELYQITVYSPTKKCMVIAKDKEGNPLPKRPISNATINYRMAVFAGMHNKARKSWKAKVQIIDFAELKLKKKPSVNNTVKDMDEAQKLWDVAPPHVRHFIVVTLSVGWRLTNVLTLNGREQIDLTNNIMWTFGKGGKHIVSAISPAFRNYIIANGLHEMECVCAFEGQPVKSIATAWKTMFKNAKVTRKRRHDLRHTFGTWLYQRTGDQRLVQEGLAHSDIATSMGYTHTTQTASHQRITEAMNLEFKPVKAVK